MYKIILFLLISCFCFGQSLVSNSGGSSGGGTSYADINFYWGAQSATAEKSAGDTSADLLWGAVMDNTFGAIGDTCVDFPGNSDQASFDISSNDILDPLSGRVGFYAYITTSVQGQYFFIAQYDVNNKIAFYDYGGTWALRYLGSSSGTTVTEYTTWSPSLDTWYFVECVWGGATYTLQVLVDGVDVGNNTSTLPIMTNDPTTLVWGIYGSVAADAHMDQMLSSDDPTRDLNAIKNLTSFPD